MSAARPPQGSPPLAGLKVLELGQLIAGPFAGKVFAEFGAEVIKVEPPASEGAPGGDPLRQWRLLHEGTSLWWYVQARNKKSITVDLRKPEGQEIVRRLARDADFVIENFRPGTLEKWGLGYDALAADNPGLIMIRLSGFGQTGPYRDQPGFGAIGESMGGMRHVTGFPDRPPVRMNISIGDALASLHGVIGALMALHHRDAHGGKGQVVDVALYEAVFNMMESLLPEYDLFGEIRERIGTGLTNIVPSNTYTTRDRPERGHRRQRRQHLQAADARDRARRPRPGPCAREQSRPRRAHRRHRRRDRCMGGRARPGRRARRAEGRRRAARQDLQCGGHRRRSAISGAGHDPADDACRRHQLKLPGIVPKLSETPGSIEWVGPKLGEHTDEVLRAAGYSAADIERLRASGAI